VISLTNVLRPVGWQWLERGLG